MCTHTHTTHTHQVPNCKDALLCSLCTIYEQAWEMCKLLVDGRAKGEGSDSISCCPEFTFTLVLACKTIVPVASTVDLVTMLKLVLDLCLAMGTHTHSHHMHTHTHTTTYKKHTHNKHEPSLSGRSGRTWLASWVYECGCLGTASWFVFKTWLHSCYFCVMHPGVILGLRGSMLNGMTNVDTITSK